jgi:uncharacterized membrane protein HdeD (DUF308 family)
MPIKLNGLLNPRALIFRGVISLLFGILALAMPGPGLLAIAIFYGAYAFTDGIFAFATGFRRGRNGESWGFPIFEGVLGVGAGVFTFFWPGLTLYVLSLIVGFWAATTGVVEIVGAFKLKTYYPQASTVGRICLGIAGLISVALGVTIFAVPAVGMVALLAMIAGYAIVFGALMLGLGVHLRKDERHATHEVPPAQAA